MRIYKYELNVTDRLRRLNALLVEENKGLLQANRDCNAWFDSLIMDHQKALKTLDEIARLGGIDGQYGNSTGNEMAIRCLYSLID